MASGSGWNSRSFMWMVTRVSSFAVGIDRSLQTLLPFRAQGASIIAMDGADLRGAAVQPNRMIAPLEDPGRVFAYHLSW
jgi:hypothetical protein